MILAALASELARSLRGSNDLPASRTVTERPREARRWATRLPHAPEPTIATSTRSVAMGRSLLVSFRSLKRTLRKGGLVPCGGQFATPQVDGADDLFLEVFAGGGVGDLIDQDCEHVPVV